MNLLKKKLFTKEHYEKRKETRRKARSTRKSQDFSLKSPHGNWVQVKDTPISNGYILQFNTDISEVKKAELELAEKKERYSAKMEALSGFAYEWDAETDQILIFRGCEKI